jgi:dienelactone hydrolase
MKKIQIIALFSFLIGVLCFCSEGLFTPMEREVRFEVRGQSIKGILTVPAEKSALSPAVLLLHGFLGHKDDLVVFETDKGVYQIVAERFAEQGVITLRFDFRGSGESDGKWEDTTFTSQLEDSIAALDFLEEQVFVQTDALGVIGLSQGGLIASCLGARDGRVKSMVLWSPVSIPAFTYGELLSFSSIHDAFVEDAIIQSPISWGGTTQLRSEFFREFFLIDPLAEISLYHGPLLVAVGSEDPIVFPQPYSGQLYLTYHEGMEEIVIYKADHIFNLFYETETVYKTIDRSLSWFLETM